jgi:predicted transcriptional regulator
MMLILLGILSIVGGNFIGGLWWVLIGLFLRSAAQMSLRSVITRQALQGHKVREFMRERVLTAPAQITLSELVEDYIYRHHYKFWPVEEGGRLEGCVTTKEVKEVPREAWGERAVGDIVVPCGEENAVGPDDDAMDVLARMNRTGRSRMMVVQGGELLGIITLKDLLKFLSLKLDLEGE